MSNAFTNFLGGIKNGIFGPGPSMKDFQHADRLYVRNNYARAPKSGFLYFVDFTINVQALSDKQWREQDKPSVGLLVKRLDLPKFKIMTETLNQYNRKTQVQTKLNYEPVTMDFHDDNSDITNKLWQNYYRYYFADSLYNKNNASAFTDNKYSEVNYAYGLDNFQRAPFFTAIDIYVLHQQKFTQYTLVNPIVTAWAHDALDQSATDKVLASKMSLMYESVEYNYGKIDKNQLSGTFTARYYDKSPSPLGVAGNGTNTLFGAGGVLAGAGNVFGQLASGNILGAAIAAATVKRNLSQINKATILNEVTVGTSSILNNLAATGTQPNGIGNVAQTQSNQSGLGVNSNLGINIFGTATKTGIAANPSNITTK